MQNIQKLDDGLQGFIEKNFSKFKIISYSLRLLKKLKAILKSNTIKNRLESKYETILQNYGAEIDGITKRFEEHRPSPPIIRNMPTEAGKIIWVRHLFEKLNSPIQEFPENMIIHKEMKKYIDKFNLIGKNLVVYEMYYTGSWCKDIERAKSCLQTQLLVKSEDSNQKKIKVNFEKDIQKLIREAKALDREGIEEIPESAKIILLQEEKFKNYYYELDFIKNEYERIIRMIQPVMKDILSAHVEDLDLKLRPGMVTLTWTSMNIDGFLQHVQMSLSKLEQLIITINDIIDNRIENNLKMIGKVVLVKLPEDGKPMSLDDFVEDQQNHIKSQAELLISKNIEIERAVDDLLDTVIKYPLDNELTDGVDQKAAHKIKGYYFWYLYKALLNSTQNSLNAMKNRVCGKRTDSDKSVEMKPFFEVDIKLEGGQITLSPTLEDIQKAINRAATAVLGCSKKLIRWGQLGAKENEIENKQNQSFYSIIAQDKEIVKVILLLTGSIEGTKNKVKEFKSEFQKYEWLWQQDISVSLKKFSDAMPQLQDYEEKLKQYNNIDKEIDSTELTKKIGAMSFKTEYLVSGLKDKVKDWKTQYCKDLHSKAKTELTELTENMKNLSLKLNKDVVDIKSLGLVMYTTEEIRKEQAVIGLKFGPVLEMYTLLDLYLPNIISDKEEMDNRQFLKKKWSDLLETSDTKQAELQKEQTQHLKKLKQDIKRLVSEVKEFRKNFLEKGPKAPGITPKEASDRLALYNDEYELKKALYDSNKRGEDLFGLKCQQYKELTDTKEDMDFLGELYSLYNKVNEETSKWEEEVWSEIKAVTIREWEDMVSEFATKCGQLPRGLREWQAYKDLKFKIDNYKDTLPYVIDLKDPCVKDRHWEELCKITNSKLNYEQPDNFFFKELISAKLLEHAEDVEEIINSAKKQKTIEKNKDEIKERWLVYEFKFKKWGKTGVQILSGEIVSQINEDLENDISTLSGLSANKHIGPFKDEVVMWQRDLGDVEKTLNLWIKVQILWTSLEAVFTSGDIAQHLKNEAKKFKKINKDWKKNVMDKATEQIKVKNCCQNDIIKSTLPVLQEDLESCQKELEKYLEKKRKSFPRFFFVSDPVLLKFLSQGSDPENIQDELDKLFDAIAKAKIEPEENSSDKKITEIMDARGDDTEPVKLTNAVLCVGNIEDWLQKLEKSMQDTVKQTLKECYLKIRIPGKLDLDNYLRFTAQVCLVGLQMKWTRLIQDALEEKSNNLKTKAMKDAKEEISEIQITLTKMCKGDIKSKLDRTKLETLVLIVVYLDDVISNRIKVKDPNSYEWQKYTRIYWKDDIGH